MTTHFPMRSGVISITLVISLLGLLLAPALTSSHGLHIHKDLLDESQLVKKSFGGGDTDLSKRRMAPAPKAMVPPGVHFLPMLGMFFIMLLIVFEEEPKSRQLLVLPLVFTFLLYKVLFLLEESAAIDRAMGRK